jgi:hypothetical protein
MGVGLLQFQQRRAPDYAEFPSGTEAASVIRFEILGSTGRRPVVSGSLPETDRHALEARNRKLRSASRRALQASGLRSPEKNR